MTLKQRVGLSIFPLPTLELHCRNITPRMTGGKRRVNPYSPHSVFLIASQPTSEPPLHRPSNNPTVTSPDSGRQGRVSASNHHRRKLDALLGESIEVRSRWCRNSEILERQSQSEIQSVGVPQLLR